MAQEHQVTLEDALALARRHHESGNLVLADRTYRDILRAVPDHYPSVHYLGIVLYQRGNLAEALGFLEKSVALAPRDAQCWSNYAAMLSEHGQIDAAMKAWDKAIRLNPQLADAYSSKGNAEWVRGNFKAAEKLCRKALDVAPKHVDALLNLGNALAAQKKYDDAIACWRKAVKINPAFSKAWNNWGNALRDLGRIAESAEKCRAALTHDPHNAQALNNLANALRDMGRLAEAEEQYRAAIAVEPSYADAHNNLATCLIELGRFAEAATAARYAVSFKPHHAGAYGNLSIALREQGMLAEAEAAAQRAVALRPDEADGYLDLCDVLLIADRYDEAEAAMAEARRIAPDEPRVAIKLASVLERLLRHDEAVALLRKATARAPENPMTWQRLSAAYFMAGKPGDALAAIDQALALKPDFAPALAGKANILQSMGRGRESVPLLRRGLKHAPGNPFLYYSLSQVKTFAPGDKDITAMESAAPQVARLGHQAASALHFALYKAYEDCRDDRRAFAHLRQGNEWRRRMISYDDASNDAYFKATRRAFTRARVKDLAGAGYGSELPVFIVGMPRSGTTLTEQIIAAHPQAFGAGELHDLGIVLKDGGAVTAENARKLGRAYVTRLRRYDPDGTARRITDKMPGNYMRLGEIVAMLPRAKIVHCRRGAMDTLLSCYKQNFARGQYWSYDQVELARHYKTYLDMMDHWRRVLPPGSFIDFDYEELVGDFETQARRLIDYIGLDWHPACLKPHKQKRAIMTASKMQVVKPVYSTSVKGWKRYEKELKPLRDELKRLEIPLENKKSVTKAAAPAKKKTVSRKKKK